MRNSKFYSHCDASLMYNATFCRSCVQRIHPAIFVNAGTVSNCCLCSIRVLLWNTWLPSSAIVTLPPLYTLDVRRFHDMGKSEVMAM